MSEINLDDIVNEVKILLLRRLQDEEIDTKELVKLMEWVYPKCVDESKLNYQIVHKFEVIKPQLNNSQQTPVLIKSGENEIVESTEQTEEVN